MTTSLLVIGAGPAGLTAAYEASKIGINPTVLESDRQVGGLSRTVNYKGYRFDIGGHRFFSKVPLINKLWEEILSEDFLLRPRLSRIHYREHFFDYPLKAFNALAGLGPIEAALVGLSYTKARLFPHQEETNLEQWVSNRFGDRLYRMFFKTYTEKVWGIPCDEISADWAAQRIKNLSLREAVRSALLGAGKTQDGEVITTLIDQFHYPRLGPGMMWECCRDILTARGHQTISGVTVDRIRHRNGRVEAVYGKSIDGRELEFGAEHFISTMLLRELIFALDPAPPDNILQAAHYLRYRDYLTAVLIVNRDAVFPDNWIYIHSPDVKMGRIQNYKNWSPEMVPDSGRTSLGLEYFLWEKDEEWTWPDERLIELGIKECARIGLIEPSEVQDGTVVRMKKAYPVYDGNYRESLALLQQYIESFENLQTVGRNGLHRYNNQDHSMLTGVYAARNIAGEKNDVWSVNTEMEYHEEVRGEKAEFAAEKNTALGDRLVPARVSVSVPAAASAADDLESRLSELLLDAAFAKIDPLSMGISVGAVIGFGLFLATAILLFKGGELVGPNLSLLANYLPGFSATWPGAFVGMVEAGIAGFLLGVIAAWLRNYGLEAYASMLKRRAEAESRRELLDKI
jgi:protoporphyrinogen oxidase